ncbi:MAG: hypothetical protein BGO78_04235 [Chloroflexi bacterium 44-23]|nr:MAG: hypothetical protein BGO78_04235 [Chloroflexi bacterium 44-23]
MEQIDIRKRVVNGLLLGYLIFIFVIFVYALIIGVGWLKTPFIGKFLEPSLIFSPLPPSQLPSNQNLGVDTWQDLQLIGIDGQLLGNENEIEPLLKNKSNQALQLIVRPRAGFEENLTSTLTQLPLQKQISYFYIPALVAWLFLLSAFSAYKNWVLGRGRPAMVIFSGAMVVMLVGIFDILSTHSIFPLWIPFAAIAGAGFFHLAMQQLDSSRYFNQLIIFVYLSGLAAAFYCWFQPFGFANPVPFRTYIQTVLWYEVVVFVISILLMLLAIFKTKFPTQRQSKAMLLGVELIAFLPIFTWLVISQGLPTLIFSWLFYLPLIVFPVLVISADIKNDRKEKKDTQAQLILYGLLALFVTLGFAFLVSGLSIILFGQLKMTNPILNGFIVFLLAMAFFPVKKFFDNQISSGRIKIHRTFEGRLNDFSNDLTHLTSLIDIINLLRLDIQGSIQAQIIHVYLHDPARNLYYAVPGGITPTSDIVYEADSPLISFLEKETGSVYFSNLAQIPDLLKNEVDRIRLLAARLFIPIQGQKQLLGWVAVSNRLDGESYNAEEINYLQTVVRQSTLAIERSLMVVSLEKRINELDVLTKAAQGVNYTVQIEDIYEFVYNQVFQVLESDFFGILLCEPDEHLLNQVFCIEKGERITLKENIFLDTERMFETTVIKSGKMRVIRDYQKVVSQDNKIQINSLIHSAIIVPLNTGAETIGILILGFQANELAVNYDLLTLLQALADQFAGALVKARLFNESERRGKQLATLNSLTQQLTATLSLNPLYENILNISMDIFHSRGGALLLTDSVAQEMEYKICRGDFDAKMVGKRIPYGTGISGKAISSLTGEIVYQFDDFLQGSNSAVSAAEKLQSVMVVPLISKNEAIGALELLGRLDGLPFNSNDLEVLVTFAAQASIAIENAQLYSNTDLALTQKIEELSIMQRIDRELNSTLNLQRALDITLHWAIRKSKANAGVIGQVVQTEIRLEVYEGYDPDMLRTYLGQALDTTFMDVGKAFEIGKPQQKMLKEQDQRLHPETRLQVVIPIRRKEQKLAFFLLEFFNAEDLDDQTIDFLVRLSEHASYALVNSQLYAEVQSANLAKSEFVNLVAHELKNPMTSIKGYSELLAGGAVGIINDSQANFLATIRANIDRMNTLISDLNDLSKIEAGRLRMDFKEVDLRKVVEDVLLSNKHLFEEKQQTITVDFKPELPPVWADPHRMSQVFINLVSNAIKYSEDGTEIIISADKEQSSGTGSTSMNLVHVRVVDKGIGIRDEDQQKIFQKFFRSEDPKIRESTGTGLGLNITRSIVELQGGKIWFESEFRKGTTFHLLLPVSEGIRAA